MFAQVVTFSMPLYVFCRSEGEKNKCNFNLKADTSLAAEADGKTAFRRHTLPQGGHHVAEVVIIGLFLGLVSLAFCRGLGWTQSAPNTHTHTCTHAHI